MVILNTIKSFIIYTLSAYKIVHWDVEIRELAAKALGEVTFVCPSYVCSTLMRVVPAGVVSPSLATRHGCVMFAAEVILSLSTLGPIAPEVAEEISQVVPRIEKARMYRFVFILFCVMHYVYLPCQGPQLHSTFSLICRLALLYIVYYVGEEVQRFSEKPLVS